MNIKQKNLEECISLFNEKYDDKLIELYINNMKITLSSFYQFDNSGTFKSKLVFSNKFDSCLNFFLEYNLISSLNL